MRVLVVCVIATVVLLAVVAGTVLLLKRHSRTQRASGREPWQRQDVLGIVSLVVALVLGVSSTAIALGDSAGGNDVRPTQSVSPGPVSPSPSPTPDLLSLHEGGDVSAFVDVLGQAGYRRSVPTVTTSTESALREYGWAKRESYMVRALVDANEQVLAFSMTSLSAATTPRIPYLAEASNATLQLRTTSFEELSTAFDPELEPAGRVTGLPAANGRWFYSEIYQIPNPLYRTFVMSYGYTGAGFRFDDDLVYPLADSVGDCSPQPCLGEVRDEAVLASARQRWPVTTATVIGDGVDTEQALDALLAEPLADDVDAAVRR